MFTLNLGYKSWCCTISLDAPQGGTRTGGDVDGIGQLFEGDSARLAESTYKVGHQPYPCQIDLSPEMCIEYCRQFIIFNASIGCPH